MTDHHTIVICDTDGCLTDGTVYVDWHGQEALRFNKRDGWLLREAAGLGIRVVVITMDPNPGPSQHRALKMSCEHIATTTPEEKAEAVRGFKAEGKRVVYIGDSPQDLLAMWGADVAFVPHDADGILDRVAYGRTRAKGGEGVLHEVLQRLIASDGMSITNGRGGQLDVAGK